MKTESSSESMLITSPSENLARQDWSSARFVEEGVEIQLAYGTRYAAAFLRNRMINIDVARRVLLTPSQRRGHLTR